MPTTKMRLNEHCKALFFDHTTKQTYHNQPRLITHRCLMVSKSFLRLSRLATSYAVAIYFNSNNKMFCRSFVNISSDMTLGNRYQDGSYEETRQFLSFMQPKIVTIYITYYNPNSTEYYFLLAKLLDDLNCKVKLTLEKDFNLIELINKLSPKLYRLKCRLNHISNEVIVPLNLDYCELEKKIDAGQLLKFFRTHKIEHLFIDEKRTFEGKKHCRYFYTLNTSSDISNVQKLTIEDHPDSDVGEIVEFFLDNWIKVAILEFKYYDLREYNSIHTLALKVYDTNDYLTKLKSECKKVATQKIVFNLLLLIYTEQKDRDYWAKEVKKIELFRYATSFSAGECDIAVTLDDGNVSTKYVFEFVIPVA